jgi:SAM-dependent methyltransferase
MSASSKSSSRAKPDLSLDPDHRARLGETRYRLIKLWVQDVNGAFDAAIAPHIHDNSVILDAGASRGDPDLPSMERARMAVASDVDLAGLRANELASHRLASWTEALPFADESFDVVVCKFLVEHLERPERTFLEFLRVLRPGGVVAILTPNRWSVFAMVACLIPYRLKQAIKANLFGGHEEDTFRTWYRANSVSALQRRMTTAGFAQGTVTRLVGMWAFFIFNGPLARLVRRLEYLQLRIPVLRACSTQLMGVWQKPNGGVAP